MPADVPPHSAEICQRLLRGYQFSRSDLSSGDLGPLYAELDDRFVWFQNHLAASGFSLVRDGEVMLLEKEQKELTNEERQTVVTLFLLSDLWLEQGGSYADLFSMPMRWFDLSWLRDGYGREYLAQVGIQDLDTIEDLWRRIARKGFVTYHPETRTLTLRDPAARILTMARRLHQHLRSAEEDAHA
ncbi:hypothetical protein EYB53_010780 [Candidatus Chloroploca sp. M-50]|uniref:Uncharacterized protein n=1 Tax=Candidatus Chloroploca mongolica TaxID=2528176 RepID=A0ABS4D9V2_9CHLR|nr:hypothetical protein [Candidatus Chloroploca mongolica]MBP1466190.1 hypothetical protein [Candidatus Chloroploca mongolica]NCC31555.1 hypothetical protein [Chloroflexia bacterium]